MKKNEELLENGSFRKLFFNLCVPTIVIMLVTVLYNMADTFFIGKTNNPDKIAALSLCGPLFSILTGLGTLLGSGGCTLISLALGKRDYKKIKACTSLCFTFSLLIGFLFLLITLFTLEPVCVFLGADASTLPYVYSYVRIIALGSPIILFTNIFTNLIRADGDAVASMICNLLGTVSNIVLDALFIMVFSLDVEGAAMATVAGNLISTIYLICHIRKNPELFSLTIRNVKLEKDVVIPLLTLGIPLACSTILMSFSHIFSNRLMMSYGAAAVAAQNVAGKVGMLLTMLVMGICMGLQPAISYNHAAGNRQRVKQILQKAGLFSVFSGTVLSIVCFLLRDKLMMAFINNQEVLQLGKIMMSASVSVGPFYGFYQLCQVYLQATGKASYATIVAILDKGVFYLPVLYLLNALFGMYGAAFTATVTLFFSILAGFFFVAKWNKKLEMTFLK